eukprot:jgi/Botrbrau1/16960/Bobra.49_2s0023.1
MGSDGSGWEESGLKMEMRVTVWRRWWHQSPRPWQRGEGAGQGPLRQPQAMVPRGTGPAGLPWPAPATMRAAGSFPPRHGRSGLLTSAKQGRGSTGDCLWRDGRGAELARVLGGGVVPGSLTLVGGDPGVGKSTLLLQVSAMLADVRLPTARAGQGEEPSQAGPEGQGREEPVPHRDEDDPEVPSPPVLYVSAEESVDQVSSRAERMGLGQAEAIYLFNATRVDDILREIIRMRPRAVVVDSIQTVYLDDVAGSAGSVTQVRECATALLHVAKREGVPIFLVGHVTKAGDIAGPRVLEHIVDCVLYMEGERGQTFRLLRGIKNRYGPTDEVGVFQMGEAGLQAVLNPSAVFLEDREAAPNVSAAVTVMVEGTRPLLLEVQALCSRVNYGQGPPLRIPTGVNRNRLALIIAVLTKHLRLRMFRVDVHTNVVGGLLMQEPATDLALAVAIVSSYFDKPTPRDIVVFGEIGLGGELRAVSHVERRLIEAAKLGFAAAIVPAAHAGTALTRTGGIRIIPCQGVTEALAAMLGPLPAETPSRRGKKKQEPDPEEESYEEDLDASEYP